MHLCHIFTKLKDMYYFSDIDEHLKINWRQLYHIFMKFGDQYQPENNNTENVLSQCYGCALLFCVSQRRIKVLSKHL